MDIVRLRGIGVSPGIAMGDVVLPKRVVFTSRREAVPAGQIEDELARLEKAVVRTRADLVKVRETIRDQMGEESSFIFEAHLMILDDPALRSALENIIRDERARPSQRSW